MPQSAPQPQAHASEATIRTIFVLLASLAILVALVLVQMIGRSVVWETRQSLQLPALSSEKAQLPAELRDKALPLDDLYRQLQGANLDQARAYVAFYSEGQWGAEAWGAAPGLQGAISDAWQQAQAKQSFPASHAMLVVVTDRTSINPVSTRGALSDIHRGVRGVFVEGAGSAFRLSPTKTIATNHSVEEELKAEAKRRKLDYSTWLESGQVYSFSARQFYIPLQDEEVATETLRGNELITVDQVTQDSVRNLERGLSDWMFNNLQSNGRMTYLYSPSQGREATTNNMIRQWMATVAMARASQLHPERYPAHRVAQNIRYNLAHFYRQQGELGYIEYQNQAKLGAAALATIAIMQGPNRAALAQEEDSLFRLTWHLWQNNGRFLTFLKPESRNDENQNFYSGEALLAWAFLYEQNKNPEILARSMKSFAHYRQWHRENRNPAFIPWHTQAYFIFYQQTHNSELKDWIFEMNDWLVDVMQAHSRQAYDDTIGRFYDPISRRYGVPHASSTGVYLEGLIDAFALARQVKDHAHQEKYRRAIVLGLRSAMQLQFKNHIDMYYAGNRSRLRGGMRTTVFDNEIRVDNVQHVLMGVQKILREFEPKDFRLH